MMDKKMMEKVGKSKNNKNNNKNTRIQGKRRIYARGRKRRR